MQVATFADALRNNRSGTNTKPFLATIAPGKTGLSKGRVTITKIGPHYYQDVKHRESAKHTTQRCKNWRLRHGHCKHVTRIKNVSDLDPVEHPEIMTDVTCWKTVENPNAVPHTTFSFADFIFIKIIILT